MHGGETDGDRWICRYGAKHKSIDRNVGQRERLRGLKLRCRQSSTHRVVAHISWMMPQRCKQSERSVMATESGRHCVHIGSNLLAFAYGCMSNHAYHAYVVQGSVSKAVTS